MSIKSNVEDRFFSVHSLDSQNILIKTVQCHFATSRCGECGRAWCFKPVVYCLCYRLYFVICISICIFKGLFWICACLWLGIHFTIQILCTGSLFPLKVVLHRLLKTTAGVLLASCMTGEAGDRRKRFVHFWPVGGLEVARDNRVHPLGSVSVLSKNDMAICPLKYAKSNLKGKRCLCTSKVFGLRMALKER